ncbi:MAG TPA: MFS transporter [Candidatus Limnocylindria bacterium]|nr:MFS transporter [Candidatus Limnocylindria bacterium]
MSHGELPPDLSSQSFAGAGTVFRNRSFVLLWAAQALSQLASNMVLAALMAVVFRATGSNTAIAILILSFLVPAVVFSALAGVLVERSDARLIMLGTNVLRAVGVIAFIFVGGNVALILLINLFVATMTAVFAPAELTAIPRIVERRHLMAANSIFVLTINATFAIGFGFLGPLLLTTADANAVYIVVAVMFGLAAAAIVPLPAVLATAHQEFGTTEAGRALTATFDQVREGIRFVRENKRIAWSLAYLGIAASLIGVMGAIGPGFATDILRLSEEDFFFIMGPAGLGAVMGILFLNAYGKGIPRRLTIDIGLVAMGITLIGLAVVKPVVGLVAPAVQPIQDTLPTALAPIVSLIAVVVVIAVTAGVEYAFVAIPSQTALQEELPVGVRGRIFGILNTLLSVASFLPVIAAPAVADVLNIIFPGAGIPVVMAGLGIATLWAGVASWRHNARSGLHAVTPPPEPGPVDGIATETAAGVPDPTSDEVDLRTTDAQ